MSERFHDHDDDPCPNCQQRALEWDGYYYVCENCGRSHHRKDFEHYNDPTSFGPP